MLAEQLQLAVDKFQKATEPSATDEINDIIDIYKKIYNEELSQEVTKILINYGNHNQTATASGPGPKPKQTTEEESEPADKSEPEPGSETEDKSGPGENSESAPGKKKAPEPEQEKETPSTPPKHKSQKKADDVFTDLSIAGYTEKEIALLRKAYNYMGFVCTISEKKKLARYMEWAVKNIVKEETI